MNRTALAIPFLFAALLPAQFPTAAASPPQRFVDWSADLDHPGAVVLVGRLGALKEGKRERLADGQLGGGAAVRAVAGTQFFKVPATTVVTPRQLLHGRADKLTLAFDLQLARLPDGKEERQVLRGTGAALAEGTLALLVVVPRPKGKGHELRHVIPFDPAVDKGADPEASFVDAMADFAAVNQRKQALTTALAAADAAKTDAERKATGQALQELLDRKLELKQPANDPLLTMHLGPLEQRARDRLAAAAKANADK